MKEFLRYAAVPVLFVVVFAGAVLVWTVFDLPSDEEIIELTRGFYGKYGYWFALVGALIEGALFINWYLPGSIVIVFGVVFSQGDPLRAVVTVALVVVGFFVTAILNYVLGKYGWYHVFMKLGLKAPLERIKLRTEKLGMKIILITYFHPNVGALTATSAGILRAPFGQFLRYSLVALIAWNALWGIITYLLGPVILQVLRTEVVAGVLLAWVVFAVVRFMRKRKLAPATLP